jgi:hypothetical protein
VSHFTEIRPVGTALIRGDRRTDGRTYLYMTKGIGTFFATVRTCLKISQTFHVVEAEQILKIGKRYLLPEASKFQHHIKLYSKCTTLWSNALKWVKTAAISGENSAVSENQEVVNLPAKASYRRPMLFSVDTTAVQSVREYSSYLLKLYNDQRNAHVFNLFIHLLLPYMFQAFF